MTTLSVAQAQNALAEVVDRAADRRERIAISRNGRPVAAVVALDEVEELDRLRGERSPGGLLAIVGQWEGFEEIEPFIEEAVRSRQQDMGRPVFLE